MWKRDPPFHTTANPGKPEDETTTSEETRAAAPDPSDWNQLDHRGSPSKGGLRPSVPRGRRAVQPIGQQPDEQVEKVKQKKLGKLQIYS
jgi:hypothetical protein